MPIFDFACRGCGHQFEMLVRGGGTPACPACQGTDLEKLLSLPAVKTETTHGLAMQAAKRRDQRQGTDRVMAQREYEANHD
jgi:putative FmdB family regulatory protein